MAGESLTKFVHEILAYAKTNLPIREVSYETVTQLVRALSFAQWSASPLREYILKEFAGQTLENISIEQIGLSLAMKEYYEANGQELPYSSSSAEESKSSELVVSSSVRKLLSSKYLPQLHTAMFSAMQHYAIGDKLHSTWSTIMMHLWRHYPIEKFESFWQSNVEEALFGGSTSTVASTNPNQIKSTSFQKKFIGFQVVVQVLALLPGAFAQADKAAPGSVLASTSLSQVVSLVFRSKNFLRTLVNNMSSGKHVLYPSTQLVRRALLAFAQAQPHTILTIISHLEDSSAGGHQRFDARTNSNTVIKLLEGLDAAGVEAYVDKLVESFLTAKPVVPARDEAAAAEVAPVTAPTPKKGKKAAAEAAPVSTADAIDSVDSAELAQQALDSTRGFCVEQLFLLARNKNLPTGSWLKRALDFLFYFGFFKPATVKSAPFAAPTHAVSEKTRALMADKLFHLLNELLPHAPVSKRAAAATKQSKGKKDESDSDEEEETEKSAAELESSMAAFHGLFSASNTTLPFALQLHRGWTAWTAGKKTPTDLLEPLSGEESAARDAALAYIDTLRQKYDARLAAAATPLSEEDKAALSQLRSLQMLLQHLALLLLRPEDREFAAPLLEEIQEGSATLFEEKKPAKKSSRKSTAAAEPEKPIFINVLIDILLSLLVRPSTLFREIAKSTFLAFVGSVNEEALDELLLVLRKKDQAAGDDADEEDEDEANFPDSDEEEEEAPKPKESAPAASKKGLSALDAEAAANAAKFAKFAARDSDDDADDDEMIDLDRLEALEASEDAELANVGGALDSYDAHLGNLVRLRNEKKLIHKETAQQSLHFKLRVCDLLEVFFRAQATSPLVFRTFIPLLLAIDASRGNKDAQQLHQRLVTLFKRVCAAKEHPPVTSANTQEIRDLMKTLMARAVKTVSRETLALTNLAILFLAKITLPHDPKEQVESTVAAVAGPAPAKKGKAAAAAVDTPTSFVLGLYRAELVPYLSVRHHGLLNTKFFTDFFARFPTLAWSFVSELSALARAKLPESPQAAPAKPTPNDALYASSAFRRVECFTLLLAIFQHRRVLKEHGLAERFLPALPNLVEAIRSALVAATLPKPEVEDDESADEKEEDDEEMTDAAKESAPASTTKLMSKAERAEKWKTLTQEERDEQWRLKEEAKKAVVDAKKLRVKEKKKAQRAKAKEEKKAAAKAAAGNPKEAKARAEAEWQKSNVNRLKTVLKCANQVALALENAPMSSALTAPLIALPAALATPLKAAIGTFLISAKIDPSKVRLNIDAKLLNKPNPNQLVKKPVKGASTKKAAASNKKSAPKAKVETPAVKEEPVVVVKKSNNRNRIQPEEMTKKRPAETVAEPAVEKKQKTDAAATPAKESKRKLDDGEEKKSKKSKQ